MDAVVWLPASTLAVLTIIGLGVAALRRYGKRAIERHELLQTIADHTKQLTPNKGSHLSDVVRATAEQLTRTDEKVDGIVAEQSKVADELTAHRESTARELGAVWRELATRQMHKAADQFLSAADRAERTIEN